MTIELKQLIFFEMKLYNNPSIFSIQYILEHCRRSIMNKTSKHDKKQHKMIKHLTNNNNLVSDPIWFTYHQRKILLSNRIQNTYHKARMNDDNLVLDQHEIHKNTPYIQHIASVHSHTKIMNKISIKPDYRQFKYNAIDLPLCCIFSINVETF